MLRTAIRASSALALASLMYSLRRSSVSCGMTTRMEFPSLLGFTPRSASRMTFSMAAMALRSKGVISMVRGSGELNVASCCSGVGAP